MTDANISLSLVEKSANGKGMRRQLMERIGAA